MITLKYHQWTRLQDRLRDEYTTPSIWLMRSVMRRELGFVIREDNHWDNRLGRYRDLIHLDFYDDRLKSWFVLKYAEYL
jgi:hypothetical protein